MIGDDSIWDSFPAGTGHNCRISISLDNRTTWKLPWNTPKSSETYMKENCKEHMNHIGNSSFLWKNTTTCTFHDLILNTCLSCKHRSRHVKSKVFYTSRFHGNQIVHSNFNLYSKGIKVNLMGEGFMGDVHSSFSIFLDFWLRSSRHEKYFLPELSKLSQKSMVKIFHFSDEWKVVFVATQRGDGVHPP